MELRGKSAVIYGAGSEAAGAVARAFASQGAAVFLTSRAPERLEALAREIRESGGSVETSRVDSLNSRSVENHASYVANEFGSLDVSFNLAFHGVVVDSRLTRLSPEEFANRAFTRVRSNFITFMAAARRMAFQGGGTILAVSDGTRLSVAGAAIEAICGDLAGEVSPYGVRVICLKLGPLPAEPVSDEAIRALAMPGRDPLAEREARGGSVGLPERSSRTYSVGTAATESAAP